MKWIHKNEKQTAVIILITVLITLLTAAAVFCIHKFFLNSPDEIDEEEYDEDDEEFIDENGVCYTDEKNFVD